LIIHELAKFVSKKIVKINDKRKTAAKHIIHQAHRPGWPNKAKKKVCSY